MKSASVKIKTRDGFNIYVSISADTELPQQSLFSDIAEVMIIAGASSERDRNVIELREFNPMGELQCRRPEITLSLFAQRKKEYMEPIVINHREKTESIDHEVTRLINKEGDKNE